MTTGDVVQRIPAVEEVTHLTDVHDEPIRNLSHGYKQRVGVAQAIIHQPRLLILDEPTRGLDPVQIVEMRSMIRDLKQDHTVLISSHILTEISETCDRLLVLGDGAIVGSGTEEQLSANLLGARRVVVTVRPAGDTAAEAVAAQLRKLPEVTDVSVLGADEGGHELEITSTDDVRAALARALVEGGHGLIRLDRAQRQLESIFLQLVGKTGGGSN
jgi:ABC-2 type transport system ATP-binding protein